MSTPIQRIGLVSHPSITGSPTLLEFIREWANQHGVELLLSEELAQQAGLSSEGVTPQTMARSAEMIVVLGGDGSILRAVRRFARHRLPVAGVNLGHLGFLTMGGRDDTFKVLERLRTGQYDLEERMMLHVRVRRDGQEVYAGTGLNDVVVIKQPVARVIEVAVAISGTPMSTFKGDGVVFASPTGSTAYSLSVGGPIVPPWVPLMALAPISSHTLGVRPVVVSDQEVIQARLGPTAENVNLVLDGQEGFDLNEGDEIDVLRAIDVARIVVNRRRNFFKVLRHKMKWGG